MSHESRALIEFLIERPLAQRPVKTDYDRKQWALRDLRAAVRFELFGSAPALLTLDALDELLGKREASNRVWERLLSPRLRAEIPG